MKYEPDWLCLATGFLLLSVGVVLGVAICNYTHDSKCYKQPTKIVYQYCDPR